VADEHAAVRRRASGEKSILGRGATAAGIKRAAAMPISRAEPEPHPAEVLMPSVLIADDAAFMRTMIKNILTEAGYEVVGEAENGAGAVAKHRELKPDLTTMDITMPGMDGLAALREIRDHDPEARVVMCTALGRPSMVVESIKAGACAFIVKPFQPELVLEAIQKALA